MRASIPNSRNISAEYSNRPCLMFHSQEPTSASRCDASRRSLLCCAPVSASSYGATTRTVTSTAMIATLSCGNNGSSWWVATRVERQAVTAR